MAARKTTTTVEENVEADDAITTVYESDEDLQALDALEGMVAEFAGATGTVVNIYRQGEGKNLSFLFRTNPDEMSGGEIMERCRDNYGTGDYRVHIRDGARIVKNAPFSVEAKKEPDAATAAVNNDLQMMTMMQSFMASQNTQFGQIMTAFAEAFKGGNQNQQPVIDPVAMQHSMIQSVSALKAMSEPKDHAKSGIDMFVQGITLAKDLSPKDGETNSSDILVKALEMFGGPMAEMAKANLNAPTAPGLPPPLTAVNPMAPPQPTGDAQVDADAKKEYEMGLQKMVLNQQLNFLLRQAVANKDPELYAELLLDQAGEERVLAFVANDNAIDQLIELNGEVANHRQWFEALRASILELTAPEPAGENEGISGEIIPAIKPDAIPDTADIGDAETVSIGDGGDAPNA
jgi:hypothetical protein